MVKRRLRRGPPTEPANRNTNIPHNRAPRCHQKALGVPVVRPQVLETTALGAAYLAGLAVGFWKNKHDIDSQWKADATFTSGMKNSEREAKMQRWERALERSKAWEE